MTQRIEAIEGPDGELNIACMDDDYCWRLLGGWEVRSGNDREPIAGSLLDDMLYAADDCWFSPVRHHCHYLELLHADATVIATLKEDDNAFTYVGREAMGDGARHWLGEAAAPSGTVVAVTWTAPANRVREG